MEKSSLIFLTLLIVENLLLAVILLIYLYRNCLKCQKVKEIDRMFTKLCSKCSPGKEKKTNGKKEQIPIF